MNRERIRICERTARPVPAFANCADEKDLGMGWGYSFFSYKL